MHKRLVFNTGCSAGTSGRVKFSKVLPLVLTAAFFSAPAFAQDERMAGSVASYSMEDISEAGDRFVEMFDIFSIPEDASSETLQPEEDSYDGDSVEVSPLPKRPEQQPVVSPIRKLKNPILPSQIALPPLPGKKPETETAEAPATEPVIEPAIETTSAPATESLAEPAAEVDAKAEEVAVLAPETPVPPSKPSAQTKNENGAFNTEDAALYRQIFELQAQGKMKDADALLSQVKDDRLRGHVLYQRYMHPTSYTSSFDELRTWLSLYSDYPGANRVYKLALRKKPIGFNGELVKPQAISTIERRQDPTIYHGKPYESKKKRNAAQKKQVQQTAQSIIELVNKERPTQALKKLKSPEVSKILDDVEFDTLRARIAEGYLHMGKMSDAYKLASVSADRSGLQVPLAGWVAGLVAWGNGKYKDAARYFEIPARSSYASSWTASAGAFWAARSNMRAGKSDEAKKWLKEAMTHPRTFYGLVATRAMGYKTLEFKWEFPKFTSAHHDMLLNTQEGSRALALVEAGQTHLAEAELLRLNPQTPEMQEALLAYAGHAGLPALALRAGSVFQTPDGQYYDAALYPRGNWRARDEYKIDPDLIHAIMRQESKFDTRAESSQGAMGLMQLMPRTASSISEINALGSREGQELLLEPATNLDIGEKYIISLIKNKYVKGDLISMLIAYNAGPGNLKKWQEQWRGITDPMLFIELIPSRETRAYVERVLANYWIYRFREGLDTPTLDALAKGKNAYYNGADDGEDNPYKIAHN